MDAILRVCGLFDRVGRTAGKAAGWLMVPLIAVIMFDVVTRKIDFTRLLFAEFTIRYGYSISTIMQDLQWQFHAALMMLSFGFAYLANAHVRVDVFRELLPRRKQAWMEFFALLIMGIPFLIFMTMYGWTLFYISFLQNEGSDSMTGLDYRWVIKFFVPFGFLITLLSVLATFGRLAAFLFGSEAQRQEATSRLEIFADDFAELEAARIAAEQALKQEEEHERELHERHEGEQHDRQKHDGGEK